MDSGAGAPSGNGLDAAAPRAAEQAQNAPGQAAPFDRLVIKTAELSLQVDDVRAAETAVRDRVAQFNGYVVKAESSGTEAQTTVRITFRVPATRFDEVLSGVQSLARKVLSRTISGDDVTEEFVDLDSRLRNLEATRDRLLGFLDKATKVEEALAVNSSLSEVQGQIEQLKGRMQFLKQNAALSTVTVYLAPVPTTPLIEEGWQPLAVAREALRNLIVLGQTLANLGIVLLVWTPVWLPLVLLAIWLRRRWRGRAGQRGGPTTPQAA
jgi:hypothetical protein